MTYCPALLEKVDKDLDEELKTLETGKQINLKAFGKKVCGKEILHPDKKIKALIKIAKGEEWWGKKENRNKIVNIKKDGSKSKLSGKKILLPEPEDKLEEINLSEDTVKKLCYIMNNFTMEEEGGNVPIMTLDDAVKYILNESGLLKNYNPS